MPTMNIKEFIDLMQTLQSEYGDDVTVIISKDPEGNGFSTFSSWSSGYFDGTDVLWPEEDDEDDEILPKDNAIILWP